MYIPTTRVNKKKFKIDEKIFQKDIAPSYMNLYAHFLLFKTLNA